MLTEACAVDHPTATRVPLLGWVTRDTAAAWERCVTEVRAADGHLIIQLWHEGAVRAEGGDGPLGVHPSLSPSGLVSPLRPSGPAATLAELAEIREAFVRGARIAGNIGASGVEVRAGHGYFLDQLLRAATNRRTDGYPGGSIVDRARYPAEIVRAIHDAVSDDLVVSFRFSRWKEVDSLARVVESPEELATMLHLLEDAGVDLFHASARRLWIPEWPGSDLGIAGWAKSLPNVPVVAVGSVGLDGDVMDSLRGAEDRLTGAASLVELARRFDNG